jgi:hypothetical protein
MGVRRSSAGTSRGCVANSPEMKRLILGVCAACLLACGGGKSGGGTSPVVAVQGYRATRWIPQAATYALTTRNIRDAQQGVRDLVGTFGVLGNISIEKVSAGLREVLLVDALSPEALAQIGIDVEGGFAIYSDAFNPTIAVKLASPAQLQAFLDAQTKLRVQSIQVEGTEVFTVPVDGVRISWAVVDGWLLVHFAIQREGDASWLAASKQGGRGGWTADLDAAANPYMLGFVDVGRLVADAQRMVPEIAPCTSLLGDVHHARLSMAGDAKHTNMRIALDVGNAASQIAASTLPIQDGWANVTAQVPIAAQWNVDLVAVRTRFEKCFALMDVNLGFVDEVGVRAGRGFLRTFDGEDRKGTGAVALDLAHKDFLAAQLDQVPMRSTFERKRTFGPYAGKSLAIPMYLTVDYVLNDQLALAAVGDGLLVQLVGRGGTVKGPLFDLALQPLGLSLESWTAVLELLDVDHPDRIATYLRTWRDARLTASLEGSWLVLSLAGTRQ